MARVEVVEVAGEFSLRGGILDVFPPDASEPVRIEFFGDEVESIRPFDPETQRSLDRWDAATLTASLPLDAGDPASLGHAADSFPEGTWVALVEPNDLREEGRHYFSRADDPRGLFTVESTFAPADPASLDHALDARGRLARDDLPPADRERRAVLGRADEGQGRARRGRGRRPRPDRLPQRRPRSSAWARSSPRPRSPSRRGSR